MIKTFVYVLIVAFFAVGAGVQPANAEDYDIVIVGGRVIDPETGLDGIRNVAIKDGTIVAVSSEHLSGLRTIDASNRVVSPGFIDMHAHGQDILSGRIQALDGVTTALELEAGMLPVSGFYDRSEAEGRPINYGTSVNWANARIAAFLEQEPVADLEWFFAAFKFPGWQRKVATPSQMEKIKALVSQGLDQGGLGIGILLGYAPGTGNKEFYEISKLAAQRGVPTYTHARFLSVLEPNSSFQGMSEIVAASAGTGAHMHISHLNSISLSDVPIIAELVGKAQQQGLRVTTEAYPYGAGSTGIGAALFRSDRWQERLGGIDASNFDVNGKRLTEEELARYQAEEPDQQTIVHFFEEDDPESGALLDQAVLLPGGVVASDGGSWMLNGKPLAQDVWPLPEAAWNHPRSAGTYARFFRKYLREQKAVNMLEAVKRVSFGPAKILQDSVPQMRKKGRIQVGADADVVVFDPVVISDKATYQKPAQPSVGFDYVIVNGVVLVDGGTLDTSVLPGRPIRNSVK